MLTWITSLSAVQPALSEDGAPAVDESQPASLLATPDLPADLWTFASSEMDAKLADTWEVRESDGETILVCTGEPYGYLKTTQVFTDFKFGLEWRYPSDVNGNSGILLYTNGHDKDNVWPTAMQVQLHQPVCGSIFPSGGAKSDNEIRDVRELCKPLNQWNSCEITSTGGQLSVEVNGRKVGVVTGCQPDRGGIALQSEGSEIHFRRIWVRKLAGGNATDEAVSLLPCSACPPWRTSFRCDELFGIEHPVAFTSHIPSDGLTRHVVHRTRLAPDGHPVHAHGRVRLDVVATSTDVAADRHHHLRSRHRRNLAD
ncbi:MAG: DUF1080 domain-containing protein [Planctomycetaceae bacterium]|nr:DUF1080 domain-containing protein [Planctomycetaceae bacterium]